MILEKLSLANFRGFEQIDLTFDSSVTVFAGVNGVGKSGILYALAVVLERVLPEFTPARKPRDPKVIDFDDILVGRDFVEASLTFVTQDIRFKAIGSRRIVTAERMAKLVESLDQVRKELRGTPKSKTAEINELKRREKSILASQKDEDFHSELIVVGSTDKDKSLESPSEAIANLRDTGKAPIAVLFTAGRQLAERPRSLGNVEAFSQQAAYQAALDDREMRLGEFMSWFNTMSKLEGPGKAERERVLARLTEVVSRFMPEFSEFRLEEEPKLRFVVHKNGVPLAFHQLSDGERGMLAILFDLTRRLAIANPESNDPVGEGKAVVMIDEIELHLHPVWQRRILSMFTETFKNCQFIVTTHSPLLLGEVDANSVRFLSRDGNKITSWTPSHALGLDANRILSDLMGVESRREAMTEELDELSRMIEEGNYAASRERICILAEVLGKEDPELIRASAMIDFLEADG